MQIVNVKLEPGQSVEVSPGAMMHHGPSIYAKPKCSCSCGRFCTGESNVKINFENRGSEVEVIGLTPTFPAKIIPVHLKDIEIICQTSSYMCGVGQVGIEADFAFCRCAHP